MVSWDDSDERLVDLTREVDLWLEGRTESVWIPITFSILDTLLIIRFCFLASGVEEGTNGSGRVPKDQVTAGSGQIDNQGPQGEGEGDQRRTGQHAGNRAKLAGPDIPTRKVRSFIFM
jgi:hypothetical protein